MNITMTIFHFSLFTFDLRSTSLATRQRHQASLCLCSRCSIGSLLTFGRPLSRLGILEIMIFNVLVAPSVRKNSKLFGFSLTYSYLWLMPNVLSFGKTQNYLFFLSLTRTFGFIALDVGRRLYGRSVYKVDCVSTIKIFNYFVLSSICATFVGKFENRIELWHNKKMYSRR